MENTLKTKKALRHYRYLCDYLAEEKLVYEKNDKRLSANLAVATECLSITMSISIDIEHQLICLRALLPFKIDTEKSEVHALATATATDIVTEGSFTLNTNGTICYKNTFSYFDSLISKKVFAYMIKCAIMNIEELSENLFLLDMGYSRINDFIKE